MVNYEHLSAVLRYIEANPLQANMVEHAGDYRWSSFRAHGLGEPDGLLDRVEAYESLAIQPAARRRRWSACVHQTLDEPELAVIRRSSATGLPFGQRGWVERLCQRLNLDLTIRSRGRPRKDAQ
jgi:putative transposase